MLNGTLNLNVIYMSRRLHGERIRLGCGAGHRCSPPVDSMKRGMRAFGL